MTKKLLLTGATGFTGKYIVDYAQKFGYDITAIIRLNSKTDFLKSCNVEILNLNQGLEEILQDYFQKNGNPDLVIHNAGLVRGSDALAMMRANYQFTKDFLEAMNRVGMRPEKFIYTSSIAAVGPDANDESALITEYKVPNPISNYGKSKLKAEEYLQSLADFPWIIARPTAIYGPGDGDMISVYRLAKKGINFRMTKNTQWLSFIFVEDFAKALFNIADSGETHEIYNISDGKDYTSSQLMSVILKAMNKKSFQILIPKFIADFIALLTEWNSKLTGKPAILSRDKLNELRAINWNVSNEKLMTETEIKTFISLEEGISKTYEWYRENGWI